MNIEETIKLIEEAKTDDLFELAKIMGQNPKTDWAGADFHECDLSNGDLADANLKYINLSSAKLINCNLRRANLTGADISGADFTGADITDTIFEQTRAENAIFSHNVGIYERIKLELIDKGAIVQIESDEPETSSRHKDVNTKAYEQLCKLKYEQYKGKWVAFDNGELIASGETENEIIKKMSDYQKKTGSKNQIFYESVGQKKRDNVYNFPA